MSAHIKVNLFFVDPPCFANSFPPGKATSAPTDRPTDRMTEIEILEDIYVAQVASLFAGVVKNSVLPRWRSAAKIIPTGANGLHSLNSHAENSECPVMNNIKESVNI